MIFMTPRHSLFPMGSPDMRHVSHIRSEFPPVALHLESSQFLLSINWIVPCSILMLLLIITFLDIFSVLGNK